MGTRWANFYVRSEDAGASPAHTSPRQSPTCAGKADFSGERPYSAAPFLLLHHTAAPCARLCQRGEWDMAPPGSRYLSQIGISWTPLRWVETGLQRLKSLWLFKRWSVGWSHDWKLKESPIRDDCMSLRNCLGLLEPILGLSFSPFNYFFLPLNFKYLRKTTNSPFIAHDADSTARLGFDGLACCCCRR